MTVVHLVVAGCDDTTRHDTTEAEEEEIGEEKGEEEAGEEGEEGRGQGEGSQGQEKKGEGPAGAQARAHGVQLLPGRLSPAVQNRPPGDERDRGGHQGGQRGLDGARRYQASRLRGEGRGVAERVRCALSNANQLTPSPLRTTQDISASSSPHVSQDFPPENRKCSEEAVE